MTRELTWQEKLELFKVGQSAILAFTSPLTIDEKLCRSISLLEQIFTDRLNGLEQELRSLQGLVHKLEEKI